MANSAKKAQPAETTERLSRPLSVHTRWATCHQPRGFTEHEDSPSAFVEALALHSGLGTLLFANELRAALLLRLCAVFGLLALVPLIWRYKSDAGLETVGFVVVMAAATLALYDIPALCRSVAFSKLRFIACQRNFVRRIAVFSHGMQGALYLGAFVGALSATTIMFDPAPEFSEQLLLPSVFFAATFVLGTIAANLEWPSFRWLMPVISFVAAILMSGFV